ncbi:SPFH domain/Band 7 family protein [Colletotrichum orchidophilum]|uniref:SPFH domain/Band 7 family protein n=1 Tax=Colletotrichum orchidophilum TaxID=1209926 RepID=A0A1G4ATG2_9PEZI|nr:SPFH domain/Band 7 family protein [Colletotrichum orchidophilum]OHE92447.1 SPFH domain/Band 7 family protein [Colletotrichum orchidophilum]
MSYRVAAPDEYLAITGMSVKTVKITKAAWVWPFQRCMRFRITPHDYAMSLQAMTKEKLQFLLPVVFTVGPDVNQRGANAVHRPSHSEASEQQQHDEDDNYISSNRREDRGDALMKYAMLLAESADQKTSSLAHLENIVKGIIEGEVRVLVSSMTMEEIFTEREVFKRRIFRNIQSELSQFGLKIYNANVKELKDAPNSNYFESLSRKAHEGASNQARIDVAEAQLRGNVGEAKRKGEQEREIAKINAETAVQKTDRDIERATAEANLATRQASLSKDVDIARVEARRALESKDEDLKREVEVKRAAAEIERLRATDVVKATIEREARQQEADAAAYAIEADAKANFEKSQRETEAKAFKTQKDADAHTAAEFNRTTKTADANAYKSRQDADAHQYSAQLTAEADLTLMLKKAEGMSAMADAYGKMSTAFGGPAGLLQYLMIEKGTYVELAKANAEAIRGLQPKISVWNTGSQAGGEGAAGGNSGIDTMRNVYQMLPPLMTTINEQTGITLPEWQFGKMNAGMQAMQKENGAKVNGAK